jgi:hypothetical protein
LSAYVIASPGVLLDGRTELLIHHDASGLARHVLVQRQSQGIVDHLLAGRDHRSLRIS